MRIIRGLHNLHDQIGNCVATIGNFDGVHRGHSEVVKVISRKGKEFGLPVVVIVFEPQPLEFFKPDQAPPRLTKLREKLQYLSALPVDAVLVLNFDRQLAALSPVQFIREILLDGLKIRHLTIGDDFRFGQQRKGDFSLLKETGKTSGFDVASVRSFLIDGQRVSSTLIREALGQGDLEKVYRLLGRNYSICGRVVHGEKRGRSIGFPTANIRVCRKKSPVQGVFAVKMKGLGGRTMNGIANVGSRPTIEGDETVLLEAHLFDFDEEIYGQHVEVFFLKKIRDEQKFSSVEQLRKQIIMDSETARLALSVN